ncbi:MAG: putative quorum-sensing-regulated virulence factor [Candidatus Saccharimonadales bacterium]
MPTDAALLAQLQTLWQAAAPIVPPAGPPAELPEPPPIAPPREENDGDPERIEPLRLGTPDEWADLQADILAGIADGKGDGDQGDWRFAENAAGHDGIERADVPQGLRWWRWATFDHLPYGDGRLPDQAEPPDGDPFENVLDDEARRYLLGRHRYPEPCGFCGGYYRHHPRCVALCDEWAVAMPFGKHKGKPVASLDHDYLAWVLKSGMELNPELRREIERVLKIEQAA